ncbi:hypothetical protein NCCP2495_14250 [Dietzia sp. NCCP-2495]|uniref:DUF6440 family protein n=1 Tax=Dietzia sp. NCCP-2495 TaxID=2934675 RepID=UPI002232C658|nr:DUF6440 family protein [Dietzia sp. NCCP-2495]GLB63546.1 hypothetical protein NCCP2495_14250 [Dietzia sp. NCCP-2495]
MAKGDRRFERIHKESMGMSDGVEIFRDTETGVCYLWRFGGFGGGLIPLLGADGKPIIQL